MKGIGFLTSSALVLAQFCATPVLAAPAQKGRPKLACDAKAISAPADTTITAVEQFASGTPYCRVDGYVTTNNPGPNRVRFMVAMPADWNGRFVYSIPGGAAGLVPDPSPAYLQQGFAVASTDKGTQAANLLDFSFRSDPGQSEDWGHRGAHVAAVASQAITRSYYGRSKLYRYTYGCSGGGQGVMMEAERYPEDFDGYIPAAMSTTSHISTLWGRIAQHVYRDKSRWLSTDELKQVGDVIMQKYDPSDGAIDRLIWDPRKIVLQRADFPFITDAQFSTLKVIEEGVPEVGGVSYPGFWMSNPSAMGRTILGSTPPPWTPDTQPALFTVTDTAARGARGPTYNVLEEMDYSDAVKMAADNALRQQVAGFDFDAKRLDKLRNSGAKMIYWTGSAENAVPPGVLLNYIADLDKAFGSAARQTFFRGFFAPGMFHCSGGEGQPTDVPDRMLDAAIEWVELGKAPDYVITSNAPRSAAISNGVIQPGAVTGTPTRTYRLCSFPQWAVFKGGLDNPQKLDVNDARNWNCQS